MFIRLCSSLMFIGYGYKDIFIGFWPTNISLFPVVVGSNVMAKSTTGLIQVVFGNSLMQRH
jgi:hypothetical protein